jgi:hypothetical protein
VLKLRCSNPSFIITGMATFALGLAVAGCTGEGESKPRDLANTESGAVGTGAAVPPSTPLGPSKKRERGR